MGTPEKGVVHGGESERPALLSMKIIRDDDEENEGRERARENVKGRAG